MDAFLQIAFRFGAFMKIGFSEENERTTSSVFSDARGRSSEVNGIAYLVENVFERWGNWWFPECLTSGLSYRCQRVRKRTFDQFSPFSSLHREKWEVENHVRFDRRRSPDENHLWTTPRNHDSISRNASHWPFVPIFLSECQQGNLFLSTSHPPAMQSIESKGKNNYSLPPSLFFSQCKRIKFDLPFSSNHVSVQQIALAVSNILLTNELNNTFVCWREWHQSDTYCLAGVDRVEGKLTTEHARNQSMDEMVVDENGRYQQGGKHAPVDIEIDWTLSWSTEDRGFFGAKPRVYRRDLCKYCSVFREICRAAWSSSIDLGLWWSIMTRAFCFLVHDRSREEKDFFVRDWWWTVSILHPARDMRSIQCHHSPSSLCIAPASAFYRRCNEN